MDDPTTSGTEGFGLMFYNARWYDPYLNHFTQPDTIVPDPGNSQDWDRYSYARNNPLKYTDPSGHKTCSEKNVRGQCMSEGDEIKSAILEENNRLARLVEKEKISSVEALARLVEYAESLVPGCAKCLIQNVGAVLTGHSNGNYWRSELKGQYDSYYGQAASLGQSGFDPIFQDPSYAGENGGNQAHHFWFYVQVGYESGPTIGNLGVILHETILWKDPRGISYQDAYLGYEGVNLGDLLAAGTINPSEVGDYIRQTLSVGSPTAQGYTNYVHDLLENGKWYPVIP
jgi:RHS repeat-associated protein